MTQRFAEVYLHRPINPTYTYTIPAEMSVTPGSIVEVPIRGQKSIGIVESCRETLPENIEKIRSIGKTFEPRIPVPCLTFLKKVAQYTLTPIGSLFRMMIPSPLKTLSPPESSYYEIEERETDHLTLKQKQTLERLASGGSFKTLKDIQDQAQISMGTVKALIHQNFITRKEKQDLPPLSHVPSPKPLSLTPEQSNAAQNITFALSQNKYHGFLLDGVTGSGKTEVYFTAIEDVLSTGKQSLILLPEIALSSQWLYRFKDHFGFAPLVWHSDLSEKKRIQNWHYIQRGEAKVIVGARSALFLPFPHLGLIIIDEEHDASFKQEEKVIYHARDMAVLKAHLEEIPIVLASATPSLETLENCRNKRYTHLQLKTRFGSAVTPEIHFIDMRKETLRKNCWISPKIKTHLEKVFAQNHQALIFINRRGYAPVTLCKSCGEKLKCRSCDTTLVFHQSLQKLVCHHCGFMMRSLVECPYCQAEDSLLSWGPGAEKLAEELQMAFPNARLQIATSDTLNSAQKAHNFVDQVQNREVDIIVGTQMIAKGYHFPYLTTVVIVDGDLGFSGSDLRAAEKTYQVLHQVSGRAGREDLPGTIFIQTHMPDHPALIALKNHDRDQFLDLEKKSRQLHDLPPFGRLAALIFSGPNNSEVQTQTQRISLVLSKIPDCDVYGPAPAVLSKLRGQYRWRLLLKTHRHILPQKILRSILKDLVLPHKVRLQVDVDPYSFF